jgi:hypothetical protein
MTIVFQMTSKVSNFIEQSHLETTEGSFRADAEYTQKLTSGSMDCVLVANLEDTHTPVSQSLPRDSPTSIWSTSANFAIE